MYTAATNWIYKVAAQLHIRRWNIVAKSVLCGLCAGLLVVLYRFAIEFGSESAVKIFSFLRQNPLMIVPWLVVGSILSLLIAYLVKYEPMAAGSGIPQVEGLLLYGMKMRSYSVLLVRFVGGTISSFFGLSLGREGPSIQIGAAGSLTLSKLISKNKLEENYLTTGGAAAGLSAAFNAPLSGIVFALEELHRSFSGPLLIIATTAALTADVVSKYFFGLRPVLSFAATPSLPESYYLWLIPIGVLSGLVGAFLNKALLRIQTLYKIIPFYLRPGVALLIALPCGLFLPAVLGGGQGLVQIAESARSGIALLALLLLVKFLFTCSSFGSGMPGGIFMPILAVGALTGGILGLVAVKFGLPAQYVSGFAICAMAGALSGSVKAPVTSVLLIVEMTGSIVHTLPVAACAIIALLVSNSLKATPIYEALLERIEECDCDIEEEKIGELVEVPVEMGSVAANKMVREIDWPSDTLVVGIQRGNKDFVPSGNTKILPGDYLIVISTEGTYRDLNLAIRRICHAD